MTPDGRFKLVIEFLTTEKTSGSFLEEIEQIAILEPIHAVEVPCGLSGYATTYDLTNEIGKEFAFEPPGEASAILDIVFLGLKDKPFDREVYERAKVDVLDRIELC